MLSSSWLGLPIRALNRPKLHGTRVDPEREVRSEPAQPFRGFRVFEKRRACALMTLRDSVRRLTAAVLGIQLGAAAHEIFDDAAPPHIGSAVQRSIAELIHSIDLGSEVDQQAHGLVRLRLFP